MTPRPDVIVSGGGPAGALAAIRLARGGARVVLCDRAAFPRQKLCGDTLNPGGVALLRMSGLSGPIEAHGLPLDGMLVTGVTGVCIRGTYGEGLVGRAWARRHLDLQLLEAAAGAGVDVRTALKVLAPSLASDGRVAGVRVRLSNGREETLESRWTIAADGRRSPLGLALGLIVHPAQPRRWAIGTYAEGVDRVEGFGEMHVRSGHYIGVAPAESGLVNLCLVTSTRAGMHDPAARLWDAVRHDPILRERCARARQVAPVVTLGPLAVDARAAGVPGLLLAGDAAGFVDPMTGDGLHIALRGGQLAADVVLQSAGIGDDEVIGRLRRARRDAFGAKIRFNRALRTLVGWPMGVRIGALGAALLPSMLRLAIATAGDVAGEHRRASAA
jgi:menaquinone-9 beta-reductase